jgi:alanyl-tRNA synthetase
MRSNEIRQTFLDFFEEKGHKIVPSAPIVVKNDPTLLFTNAGMNQFKDYFLGNKTPEFRRVADTQKCLRVSGKHNDLEEVGIDTYHHTMFEMLGNWSFGDYFKKEAISWAWELLTERYKLDKNRLYVTVFQGDAAEGLEEDSESYAIWKTCIAEDRILKASKKDNFWEMGETGPCGPCTEIHYDIRPQEEVDRIPGKGLVNNDHPQVIEIWNNVFIQYNRKADSSLEPLPDKHVDTGMGFERLTRVLQGKSSNYDTDIFQPMIRKMEKDFKLSYGEDEAKDIAFRVIADHIRAVTFTIGDGQLPSNTGAGYVIRRILRRAVRYGYTFLGMTEPYIYELVTVLAQQFKNVFPEIYKQEDFIKKVIQEEEAAFLRTLATGIRLFEKHTGNLKGGAITGRFAFELYDTYGFPFDLTELMAREKGLSVDEEEFKRELGVQKDRSRHAAVREEGDWKVLIPEASMTAFTGYDNSEEWVKIVRYRKVLQKGENLYHIVLDHTPFYPEGGGQVGDTGVLEAKNDATITIINTFKENDLIIHVAEQLDENNIAEEYFAKVDLAKRNDTAANHSATHLLHAALRKVLGTHVAQKGSLVNDKYLRFDFSHFSKMTDEEIARVEHIVNQKIREDIPLQEDRSLPIAEAQQKGAMMLFGEKYGDKVRMITFDPAYSVELCGGMHVKATGRLGFFKIISESAVAAGVRRIEAVTGSEAENVINEQFRLIKDLKESLKNPKNLPDAVESLRDSNKELIQEKEKLQSLVADLLTKQISYEQRIKIHEINEIVSEAEFIAHLNKNMLAPIYSLKIMFDLTQNIKLGEILIQKLKSHIPDYIFLVGGVSQDKAHLWLYIPNQFVTEKGMKAGQIIKEIAKGIEGGGGGQDTIATASGKNPKNLINTLTEANKLLSSYFKN